MTATVRVIVITGSMGAGKTTVLGEASDLLAAHGIAHAAIDLDALGVSHQRLLGAAALENFTLTNTRSVTDVAREMLVKAGWC